MTMEIAVTTSADRFRRWEAPLRRHGFRAVSLPCIRVEPLPAAGTAREMALSADWLMITSPRVVQVMWPTGGMPPVPVAAVGRGTSEAVQAAQGVPHLVGDADGDRLVDLLAGRLRGKRVVIPHGARANTGRFLRLIEAGADVRTVAVYETVSVPPGPRAVDGAVFGAPSAVEGWTASRSIDGLEIIGAIGEVTAAALRRRGAEPIVADLPTPECLATALFTTLEAIP